MSTSLRERNRLNSVNSSLRQARVYMSAYRDEILKHYQSDESVQVMVACNACISTLNELSKRCDGLCQRLLWLERTLL